MNFQEAHKKLFQGPFGKPKHVPQLLMRLAEIRYKDFSRFENEISVIVTHILYLLENREFEIKEFGSIDYWNRYRGENPNKRIWITDKEYLTKLFQQVKKTNSENSNVFHWPVITGWLPHFIKLSHAKGQVVSSQNHQTQDLTTIVNKIDPKLKSKFENSNKDEQITIIVTLKDKNLKPCVHLTDRKEIIKLYRAEMIEKYGETLQKIDTVGVVRKGGEFIATMIIRGTVEQLITVIELDDVEYAFEDSPLQLIR